ncbi:unnamed protein product [Macrosiphum euphorbiae]|uniref:Uncharacterized protein n=1 Tax=Macrosiphum euphorbiae TaxID=13131 RepID=A0AAV0WKC6_9HEMI|nr:unnamed protein product [Macrosiphum euphorbiae]
MPLVGRDLLSDFIRTFGAAQQQPAVAAVIQYRSSCNHGNQYPCSTPAGASFAAARASRRPPLDQQRHCSVERERPPSYPIVFVVNIGIGLPTAVFEHCQCC